MTNASGEAECQLCHGTFVELTNPWAEEDSGLRVFLGRSSPWPGGSSSSNEARPARRLAISPPRIPGTDLLSAIQQLLSSAQGNEQPSIGAILSSPGELFGPVLAMPPRSESGASLLGDYAMGNISNIIEQLMASDPTAQSEPASKTAVRRLCTTIDIGQSHVDDGWECAIHKEPFGLGEVATRLPCGHIFLETAISRWLEDHHSCPVCRFNLPTEDEEAAATAAAAAAASQQEQQPPNSSS